MSTKRKPEWFEDDSFWRKLSGFMFNEQRLAEANLAIPALLRLAKARGKDVLDLGCGPGRWAIPLARRGYRVTGVDRTRELLAQARARSRTSSAPVEWVLQDMRRFVRPMAFDLALSLFTSFGYFDDPSEDLLVLRNVFASLRPGGVLVMEMAGKEILARAFQATVSTPLADDGLLVQRHEVFDGWSKVRNEWTLIRNGRTTTWRFHITIYSGQELRALLEAAGFREVRLHGGLDGSEYGVNAQRLVAVGRKPRR